MTKMYKTARGKMIDIDKIKLTNETIAAVGNMNVNARGDILGANGEVAAGRNQVMDQVYAVADAPYSPNDPEHFERRQKVIEANRAKELSDLVNTAIQPANPEPVATEPVARGALASSVAKPVAVTQQPLPNPQEQKKASGPSRI